jgi:hypothetical protein
MAELSKQALIVENNQSFPNNNNGVITPTDLRSFNTDVIDSTVNQTQYTANSGSWNVGISNLNAFTASQQPSFTALNSFTASQLVINSGVNTFTQSASGRLNNLEAYTASFTTSVGIYDESVFVQNVNQINFMGNGITASYVSGKAVIDVNFTPLNNFTQSTSTQLNSLQANFNSFTQSTDNSIALIEQVTASYATTGSNSFAQNQNFEKNITVTQSVYVGQNIYVNGGIEATYIKTIYETSSVIYSSGSNQFGDASNDNQILSGSTYVEGELYVNKLNVTAQFNTTNAFTASQLLINTGYNTFTASTNSDLNAIHLTTQSLNDYTASNTQRVDVLSSFTGSYATTASNTFTGDQTLVDAAGNSVTLSDVSGSLMLVAKSFTSASAHISASTSTQVNLIFKNNSNTADTIISGSNNLFINPAAPTAGFKRYIGGSGNIMLNPSNVPQISGSMAFSPTMNNNFYGGSSITTTMRGPATSSVAWAISGNIINQALNIGSSVANNAEKIVTGLNVSANILNNSLTVIANRRDTTQLLNITNNQTAFAATTLNAASSSLQYVGNFGGALTLNNNASGSGAAIISSSNATYVAYNTFAALNTTITTSGSSDPNDLKGNSYIRHIENNAIFGNSNTANLPYAETGSNALASTMIAGFSLGVTGSNASNLSGLLRTEGSAFFGRYNALDGNKAQSAQTVFAVGTGTAANRKTGFLIDSGSNTFIEGSLTITGSVYQNVISQSIVDATASIDLSRANFYRVTLPASTRTTFSIVNPAVGQSAMIQITTDTNASASFTSNVKQPSGFGYTPSTGSGNIDVLTLACFDGTNVLVTNVTNLV